MKNSNFPKKKLERKKKALKRLFNRILEIEKIKEPNIEDKKKIERYKSELVNLESNIEELEYKIQ